VEAAAQLAVVDGRDAAGRPGPDVIALAAVEIAELRNALTRCLDDCERRWGTRIDLAADHYWLVEPTDAFDLSHEPTLGVGQLTNDVAEISNSTDLTAWHDLAHLLGPLARLAALLRQ
jgi:hypothetical protein